MSKSKDLFFHKIRNSILLSVHPLNSFFIEIDSDCNLMCKHCYIPSKDRHNYLDLKTIQKVLYMIFKEFGKDIGIAITGGEPLMHPQYSDIVKEINRYGFNWSLATNGTLLSKSTPLDNCKGITISVDGDLKTHSLIRGKNSNYTKILEVLDYLVTRDIPDIYITSTIHDGNIVCLESIGDLVSKYKGRVKWKINTLLKCENSKLNNLTISKESYLKIIEFSKNKDYTILIGEKNPLSIKYEEFFFSEFDSCLAGITTFGVLSNGDIVNCMVCRDHPLGNISNRTSLKEIWDSEDTSPKGLCEKHIESLKS